MTNIEVHFGTRHEQKEKRLDNNIIDKHFLFGSLTSVWINGIYSNGRY